MPQYLRDPSEYLSDEINAFGSKSAVGNKANALQQRSQQKLDVLSGYKNDTLLGMQDADTEYTKSLNGKSAREVLAPNAYAYDAVETAHITGYDDNNNPIYSDPLSYVKNSKHKQGQLQYVADALGKNANDLTTQDMIDVGNQQMIQKAADLAGNESGWKAPLIRGIEPTNLTGSYMNDKGVIEKDPLNIAIKSKDWNQPDSYGRELMSYASTDGKPVTVESAINPETNVNSNKAKSVLDDLQNGNQQHMLTADDAADISKAFEGVNGDNFAEAVAKGAGSSIVGTTGQAIDAVFNDAPDWLIGKGEEAYYNYKIGQARTPEEKKQLEADKKDAINHSFKMNAVASYLGGDGWDDTKEYYTTENIGKMSDTLFNVDQYQSAKDQKDIEKDIGNGDYGQAAYKVVTSGNIVGNVVGSVMTFMFGAGEVKAGMFAVKNGSKISKTYEKAAELLKLGKSAQAEKYAQIASKRMNLGQKVLMKGIERAGATAMFTGMVNDTLASRNEAENQKHAGLKDIAIAVPSAAAQTYIGLESAQIIMKPAIHAALKDSVAVLGKKATDKLWQSVLKAAGRMVSSGGKGAVVEGTEEYLQQWADILGKQISTGKKGDDIKNIISNAQNQLDAKVAGIEGIAGGHIAGATQAMHEIGNINLGSKNTEEVAPSGLSEVDSNELTPEKSDSDKSIDELKNSVQVFNNLATSGKLQEHMINIQNGKESVLNDEEKKHANNVYSAQIDDVANKILKIDNILKEKENSGNLDEEYQNLIASRDELGKQFVELDAIRNVVTGDYNQKLNNRPLDDINKDLQEVENKMSTSDEAEKSQLNSRKKLLEMEKLIAENTSTTDANEHGAVVPDGQNIKMNDVLTQKIWGGVGKGGRVRTGIMYYANRLLNPNIDLKYREPLEKSLDNFVATQRRKLALMQNAKKQYEHNKDNRPVEVEYGNDEFGSKKFIYHGQQSDNIIRQTENEQKLIDKLYSMIKGEPVKDSANVDTEFTNDTAAEEPPLDLSKIDIPSDNNEEINIPEQQAAESKPVASKINTTEKVKPKDEFNEYEQESRGFPINEYSRIKDGEINQRTPNESKNISANQKVEEETKQKTKEEETENEETKTGTTEVKRTEKRVGDSDKTNEKSEESTGAEPKQESEITKEIDRLGSKEDINVIERFVKELYDNGSDKFKEAIDYVYSKYNKNELYKSSALLKALKKVSDLRTEIKENNKEIKELEKDINSKEIPRLLKKAWQHLERRISTYKYEYEISDTNERRQLTRKMNKGEGIKVVLKGKQKVKSGETIKEKYDNLPNTEKEYIKRDLKNIKIKSDKTESLKEKNAKLKDELKQETDKLVENEVTETAKNILGSKNKYNGKALAIFLLNKKLSDSLKESIKKIIGCE